MNDCGRRKYGSSIGNRSGVDRDDYLTEDAVAICEYAGHAESPHICGMTFLKQSRTGNYLTNKLVPTDGLIANRRANNRLSPRGCMLREELQLDAGLPLKYQIRAILYYTMCGMFSGLTV